MKKVYIVKALYGGVVGVFENPDRAYEVLEELVESESNYDIGVQIEYEVEEWRVE